MSQSTKRICVAPSFIAAFTRLVRFVTISQPISMPRLSLQGARKTMWKIEKAVFALIAPFDGIAINTRFMDGLMCPVPRSQEKRREGTLGNVHVENNWLGLCPDFHAVVNTRDNRDTGHEVRVLVVNHDLTERGAQDAERMNALHACMDMVRYELVRGVVPEAHVVEAAIRASCSCTIPQGLVRHVVAVCHCKLLQDGEISWPPHDEPAIPFEEGFAPCNADDALDIHNDVVDVCRRYIDLRGVSNRTARDVARAKISEVGVVAIHSGFDSFVQESRLPICRLHLRTEVRLSQVRAVNDLRDSSRR